MLNIPSVRLSIPKVTVREIMRKDLVTAILENQNKITFINAGAGFGKTTLLSQVAHALENTVWVTLDGESDVYSFLNLLSESLKHTFQEYDFTVSEYLPFENKSNFITILANAFISSIEKLEKDFMFVLDDLHTIKDQQVRKLIACIIKYKPANIQFCLSSRETPWQELVPLRIRGNILELTQKEIAFTREETVQFLGVNDEQIYNLTEGWPLAINSFKMLLENGVSSLEVPTLGNEALYSYLFFECLSQFTSEMIDFLKASACFAELDPEMLNTVLNAKNTKPLLESLVEQNIFTIKSGSFYRYHTLFKEYLLALSEESEIIFFKLKAANYYLDKNQYSIAAEYALQIKDNSVLEQIILNSYKDYIKSGSFSELRTWFQALRDGVSSLNHKLLVAKGAFLSSIGNFTEAKSCLDQAIPLINENDIDIYIEAIVHKARVLRNFVSFNESNQLLDELIVSLTDPTSEQSYTVFIEKLYNLCWNSQINEAYVLCNYLIETCAKAGNVKVKSWYERYLSVIHFLAGRMREAVYYYEKSLLLPADENRYLDMHSIDIYVAKAYQMLGSRDKAVNIITTELQRLRNTGRYEELWLGYLFAAEIHYQNAFIDIMNGLNSSFEITIKYFTLADEYAPLYRKSEFQIHWTKMQRDIYSLMFTSEPKEKIIDEIYTNLDQVSAYFKTIALARLFSYFGTISDFTSAVKCAKLAIEIGEEANMMLIPTMAYGFLSRVAILAKDHSNAVVLTRRFLLLCNENGIYEYFRMRKAYDPILEFAFHNGIELEITKEMMNFAGYKSKKIYITTLGGLSVFSYQERQVPLKMRTKKERELLAFLIDAGNEGVTKEQISEALWFESTSDDIKKLIGVNLAQIKKDLAVLGVENPIVNHDKHYSICKDEIAVDIDLFEEVSKDFELQKNNLTAKKIISLYKGQYLADFEALWAISKRINYQEIYTNALDYISNFKKATALLPK